MKTTVYAVRDSDTKERVSYRFREWSDAAEEMQIFESAGFKNLEVYRTTQDLPPISRKRKF